MKQTKAEVLWNGTWYAAEVLETKDGKFSIHYTGYGDNWNEWVGHDRIRLYTNQRFEENIRLYSRLGYRIDSEEPIGDAVRVNMSKDLV